MMPPMRPKRSPALPPDAAGTKSAAEGDISSSRQQATRLSQHQHGSLARIRFLQRRAAAAGGT
eukprot:1619327-Pyramimonas_sp.AAC.1